MFKKLSIYTLLLIVPAAHAVNPTITPAPKTAVAALGKFATFRTNLKDLCIVYRNDILTVAGITAAVTIGLLVYKNKAAINKKLARLFGRKPRRLASAAAKPAAKPAAKAR